MRTRHVLLVPSLFLAFGSAACSSDGPAAPDATAPPPPVADASVDAPPAPADAGSPDASPSPTDAGPVPGPDAGDPPSPACAMGDVVLDDPPGDGGRLVHVRVDGSDSACDGSADAAAGTGACAFATIQAAVDAIQPGDDVVIHPGTYAPFELRGARGGSAPFAAQATNRTIIEGAPGNCPEAIVVDAAGAPHAFRSEGGGGSSTRTRFVTLRNLRLTRATDSAVELELDHDDITLERLVVDGLEGMSGRHDGGERPAAIRVWNGAQRIVIQEIRLLGQPGGTDASAIQLYASDSVVRRVYAERFLGNFVFTSSQSNNVFEHNVVVDFDCDTDDGCFQVYNTPNATIRYNVVLRTTPINDYMGVIGVRHGATSPRTPSVRIYGNTFVGDPTASTALRRRAIVVHPTAIGDVAIHDNVFVGYGNDAVSQGGAITVRECPASLVLDHNLYFDNALDVDVPAGGCPMPAGRTLDADAVRSDPMLDPATGAPAAGSPACGAGTAGADIGAIPCP